MASSMRKQLNKKSVSITSSLNSSDDFVKTPNKKALNPRPALENSDDDDDLDVCLNLLDHLKLKNKVPSTASKAARNKSCFESPDDIVKTKRKTRMVNDTSSRLKQWKSLTTSRKPCTKQIDKISLPNDDNDDIKRKLVFYDDEDENKSFFPTSPNKSPNHSELTETKELECNKKSDAILLNSNERTSNGDKENVTKFTGSNVSIPIAKKISITSEDEDDTVVSISSIEQTSPTRPLFRRDNHVQGKPKSRNINEQRITSSDDESDDDAFEKFLRKQKTTKEEKKSINYMPMDEFIVNTSDESFESSFCTNILDESDVRSPINEFINPQDSLKIAQPCKELFSDPEDDIVYDDEDNEFISNRRKSISTPPQNPLNNVKKKNPVASYSCTGSKIIPRKTYTVPAKKYYTFLRSLSNNVDDENCHPDALRYRKHFRSSYRELASVLFDMFNVKVFGSKLPSNMEINWNSRLTSTAGFCKCRRQPGGQRTAVIELSSKVLDSAGRVRDTLIHEMCHAVVWILHGLSDHHGNTWKYWASEAMRTFPELPPITRCHDYYVKAKYTYKCSDCGYKIGRHSKSLDVDKTLCKRCNGHFELDTEHQVKPPKNLGAFALFVKDNYRRVREENGCPSHPEVLELLSKKYRESKNQAQDGCQIAKTTLASNQRSEKIMSGGNSRGN